MRLQRVGKAIKLPLAVLIQRYRLALTPVTGPAEHSIERLGGIEYAVQIGAEYLIIIADAACIGAGTLFIKQPQRPLKLAKH